MPPLVAVEPDLIGEFFALETLTNKPDYDWLPELCWRLAPERMGAFCERAFGNFPGHPAIPVLTPTPPSEQSVAKAFLAMTWTISATPSARVTWSAFDALVGRAEAIDATIWAAPYARMALSAILYNTLLFNVVQNDTTRRDDLLQELRNFAAAWPSDTAIRESLAGSLSNTLHHIAVKGDITRCNDLLQELRNLAAAWPGDTAVHKYFASGLSNTLYCVAVEGDTTRRDDLLQELRNFAAAWPNDTAIRESLAGSLFNILNHAWFESDTTRRDPLLQELRDLATAWPSDTAVRQNLAIGLLQMLNCAKFEGDTIRRDDLLQELRDLSADWPNDAAVHQHLAQSLLDTLFELRFEGDTARRNGLLQELRRLADRPNVHEVLCGFLQGMVLNIDIAQKDDPPRADTLFGILTALAEALPDDEIVQDILADIREIRCRHLTPASFFER